MQDDKGRDIASRSMQTPVFDSKQGSTSTSEVLAAFKKCVAVL
jgi:hypothetical protein